MRIVRVMPNTPCLVGETASAMCLGGKASDEDAETVRTLFSSVGRIVQVGCHNPYLLFMHTGNAIQFMRCLRFVHNDAARACD